MLQQLLQPAGHNAYFGWLLTALACRFTLLATRVQILGINNARSRQEPHLYAESVHSQILSARSKGKKWALGYY
jgi:hypothetical protein